LPQGIAERQMAERLTDRGIAAIKPPPAGSVHYFDTEVAGLAVRVYATGRKVLVFDWRERQGGRQRRVTLGRHPVWTIGKAREHAGKLPGGPLAKASTNRQQPKRT
ncbi:MAG TPA: Arm DNA-binding domain-containing protein, partial [Beijerinckiaceae bacterium]|nr:Arm DNA-binding domain-containing protein [Beijerinckiaceae bacterium]